MKHVSTTTLISTTSATPTTAPANISRVEALEALARACLDGREATLSPLGARLGRAIASEATRLHDASGDVWSDPEDFIWEASRAWVKQEATQRLLELWDLPEKELWDLPERRHHLRRLLVSFQEEANGSPEEAIRLLREYIG